MACLCPRRIWSNTVRSYMPLVAKRSRLTLLGVGARQAGMSRGLACSMPERHGDAIIYGSNPRMQSPDPFYDPGAHAMDLATFLHHRPPRHYMLHGGGTASTKSMKERYLQPALSARLSYHSLSWCCVCMTRRQIFLPATKALEPGSLASKD